LRRAINTAILQLHPCWRRYIESLYMTKKPGEEKHFVEPGHSFWEWLDVQDDATLEVADYKPESIFEGSKDVIAWVKLHTTNGHILRGTLRRFRRLREEKHVVDLCRALVTDQVTRNGRDREEDLNPKSEHKPEDGFEERSELGSEE
jgi:hypothetical protein